MNSSADRVGTNPGKLPAALLALVFILASLVPLVTPSPHLSLLPAAFALFLILLLKKPEALFYTVIFLVPFDAYTSLAESYRFFTISKFVGFWLFVLAVVYLVLHKLPPVRINPGLAVLFMLLMAVFTISTLLSAHSVTAVDNIRRLFVAFVYFGLALFFLDEHGFKKVLPAVLTVSITVSSILSVAGYFFDIPFFAMGFAAQSVKRATGGSLDPNFLSAMIIFNLPVIAHLFVTARTALWRVVLVFLFTLNVAAVMLTFSRGGAVILAVLLLLLVLQHARRFRPLALGWILLALLAVSAVLYQSIPASYWERQKTISRTDDPSISRRMSYIRVAADSFRENPAFGTGPGTFHLVYAGSEFARNLQGDDKERDAHNRYLEILVGAGGLGLALFAAIIIMAMRNFALAAEEFRSREDREGVSLVAAYRLSFVSLCAYFFFLSANYHKYFWLALALSQIALNLARRREDETAPA